MVIFPTGLTYSRNTKAPFETNRVFATLADMFAYLDNQDQTGYLGMTVVVTSDTTASNNGVYVVTREGSVAPNEDGTMPAHPAIGQDTDAQWANVSRLASGGSLSDEVKKINTALAGKVDKTTTINGQALSGNITLDATNIRIEGSNGVSVKDKLTQIEGQISTVSSNHTKIEGKEGEISLDTQANENGKVKFVMSEGKQISATVVGLGEAAYKNLTDFDAAGAAATAKAEVIGNPEDESTEPTIYGVKKYADSKIAEAINSAMHIKGTIGTGGDITELPTSGVKVGDAYVVKTANTYAGQKCEVGDIIIATATTPAWTVIQNNLDAATVDTLGTVKLGVATVSTTNTTKYAVGNDANGKLAVAVPTADLQQASKAGHYTPADLDNTVVSAGSLSENDVIATAVSYDNKGHITAVTGKKIDVATLGGVTSISIDSTSTDALKKSSVEPGSTNGSIKLKLVADNYVGATNGTGNPEDGLGEVGHNGVAGLVPAAKAEQANYVLTGGGTWSDATGLVSVMHSDYETGIVTPGLVPAFSGNTDGSGVGFADNYFLSAAGDWRKVEQVKYSLSGGFDSDSIGCLNKIVLTGDDGTTSELDIAKVHTAQVANSTAQSLTITQGNEEKVFNGSTAVSINLDQYALASDLEWLEFN